MPDFTVTILVDDNTADSRLRAQRGFSAYITSPRGAMLFDCGADGLFLENAQKLGIDIGGVAAAALSHNHTDHAGGCAALFDLHPNLPLYLSDKFIKKSFWTDPDSKEVFITNSDVDRRFLQRRHIRSRYVSNIMPVNELPGAYIITAFARNNELEQPEPAHCIIGAHGKCTDGFFDETALVLDCGDRLAVVSGCCHNGVVNIITDTAARFHKPVCVFVGGTHLAGADAYTAGRTADYLRGGTLKCLAACHCTGEPGHAALSSLPFYRRVAAGDTIDTAQYVL